MENYSSYKFKFGLLTALFVLLTITTTFGEDNSIEESATVETSIGIIEGFQQTFYEKTVATYLGIPYAEPPVGAFRFKKPIPAKPRGHIRATRFSRRCSSHDPFDKSPYSEDCLYLNIWRPVCSDTSLKPVMVWIHGGGFVFGSASFPFYNGLALAAYGDVVVVTLNYRLSVLGFLNLGGVDGVSGNLGMHDQVLALQWVKNNIHLFGGDPSLITIFGESAGGISVGYHLVSPLSKDLFKRAILQSGATHTDLGGMNITASTGYSWKFVKELGCDPDDAASRKDDPPTGVLQCLQLISLDKIMEIESKFLKENIFETFTVTLDGSFLPEVPAKLLQKGKLGDQLKEIMIGVTSDEGSMFLPFHFPQYFGKDTPNLKEDLSKDLMSKLIGSRLDENTLNGAIKLYFEKYNGPELFHKAIYESYGDYLLTCPAIYTSEEVANHGRKVYFYEFAYSYSKYLIGKDSDFKNILEGEWIGVPHFQEVAFVFGLPLLEDDQTQTVIDMSKRIMTTWSTFARTGKPADQLGKDWPLFTKDDPRYLKLLPNDVPEVVGHHQDACDMWRKYFKNKLEAQGTSEA